MWACVCVCVCFGLYRRRIACTLNTFAERRLFLVISLYFLVVFVIVIRVNAARPVVCAHKNIRPAIGSRHNNFGFFSLFSHPSRELTIHVVRYANENDHMLNIYSLPIHGFWLFVFVFSVNALFFVAAWYIERHSRSSRTYSIRVYCFWALFVQCIYLFTNHQNHTHATNDQNFCD